MVKQFNGMILKLAKLYHLYFLDLKEKIHLGTIQIEPSSFKTDLLSISQ